MVREVFKDTPVVAFCHGTDLRQIERYPRFLKRCENIKDLDMIFTVTPNEGPKIREIFSYDEEKVTLVGGGFNQNIFNRNYEKRDDGILRVCYAGKMSRAKGVYELASSFPLVKKDIENLEYHIIDATSDEEKKNLYDLANNMEGFKVYDACLLYTSSKSIRTKRRHRHNLGRSNKNSCNKAVSYTHLVCKSKEGSATKPMLLRI